MVIAMPLVGRLYNRFPPALFAGLGPDLQVNAIADFVPAAVLDWEMCTVGDPLVDVGLALAYWTMQGGKKGSAASVDQNSSLRAVTSGPGWMTREGIIERYAKKTGCDLSRIAFYEAFARFKVAVVIQQIYFRYVQGQTRDERFRNFDGLVRELAAEALELAEQSRI